MKKFGGRRVSDLPCEPESEIGFVSCPLCGMNRILEKTGATAKKRAAQGKHIRKLLDRPKGRIKFNHMDLDKAQIFQCRVPADAFFVVEGKTLAEMTKDERFDDLISQMREQIREIFQIIGGGELKS